MNLVGYVELILYYIIIIIIVRVNILLPHLTPIVRQINGGFGR